MLNMIETELLCLRKYQLGDEVSLFDTYFSNIQATRYLQRLPHVTIQQTKSVLEKSGQIIIGRYTILILHG